MTATSYQCSTRIKRPVPRSSDGGFRSLRCFAGCVGLTLVIAAAPLGAGEKDRQTRPFKQGVSCSATPTSPFLYAGTCGARVTSFYAPNLALLLGVNHIFAAVGPDLCPNSAPAQTWILQQGTLDIGQDVGNSPFFWGGALAGAVPIDFSVAAPNLVDAALAYTSPLVASTEILNIGQPLERFADPTPGMTVMKNGRSTSLTFGTVLATNVTADVTYEGCGLAHFVDQFAITPSSFSAAGDSGSLILRASDKAPVGLLFAGDSLQTLANRMLWVYLKLGVFIDGQPTASVETAGSLAQRAQKEAAPEMARLKAIQARNQENLLRNPDVTGIGIGLAEDGNGYALIVFAKPGASARAAAIVPRQLESAPVRIVEGDQFVAR